MKNLIYLLMPLALTSCAQPTKKVWQKPNVLFIIVDDLRPQLASYGHSIIKSPNIDKLASEGVLFSRAYSNVATCGASRASVFSGLRPLWPGRFINYQSRADVDCPGTITLPEIFKNNGYTTVSTGKVFHAKADSRTAWTEKPWAPDISYRITPEAKVTSWVDPASYKLINESGRGPYYECPDVPDTAYFDGQVAEKAISDLKRLSSQANPFFLAVGFIKPHLPFNAPKKYFDLYDKVDIAENRFRPEGLPEQLGNQGEILSYTKIENYNSVEFHQEARKAYYACVSYVDAQIGKVLDALKESGKEENTIVVLIGDHGWHIGEHNFWGKHNTLDNAIHAPMIIKAPGLPVKSVGELVEFVDLFPTVCELAQIPLPGHLQGNSMVSLINGQNQNWKNIVYSEWHGARCVTTPKFSYAEWYEEKNNGANYLFDHTSDPEENVNVVNRAEYSDVVKSHKQLLKELYVQLTDTIK
jgi:arylsulfatase A-like enzyme